MVPINSLGTNCIHHLYILYLHVHNFSIPTLQRTKYYISHLLHRLPAFYVLRCSRPFVAAVAMPSLPRDPRPLPRPNWLFSRCLAAVQTRSRLPHASSCTSLSEKPRPSVAGGTTDSGAGDMGEDGSDWPRPRSADLAGVVPFPAGASTSCPSKCPSGFWRRHGRRPSDQ